MTSPNHSAIRNPQSAIVDPLIRRGRELESRLAVDADRQSTAAETRIWQRDCAALVNELSGGSKAHWLARAYSAAFLMRSATGGVIVEASLAEIVERILGVLGQARSSLAQIDEHPVTPTDAPPPTRRFEFVHNLELRPVLEQAYRDSRTALAEGRLALALITSCGILEAIITDALDRPDVGAWTFEARIAAAEAAGLIRGGCARLPPVARGYKALTDADGELSAGADVFERDAKLAGQVLRVVMRDLDPGR